MIHRLLDYLILPGEISAFESEYLRRTNRIAYRLFLLHLPVLAIVAAICDTGPLRAAGMVLFLLCGATLSHRLFPNPRHVSTAFGFAAMCMGGLLVHFGQGPMQIEMHFYFFTILALLAVFANPLVIVVAAATVAVHHLALYFLLPRSVFNYDASLWAVAVHAAFVVLESIGACFMARSFFDRVLGLERIVRQRTAEVDERSRAMRLVLDHVGQGLFMVDAEGLLLGARSAVVDRWLGQPPPGRPLWDWIAPHDQGAADMLRLGWQALRDDFLPRELVLDQLPSRMNTDAQHYELSYSLIEGGAASWRVLAVVSDVTSRVENELYEAEQREMVSTVEKLVSNKDAFAEFFAEASALVLQLTEPERPALADVRRHLHTLKGTSSVFGLSNIAAFCHEIESRMAECAGDITARDRDELGRRWRRLAAKFEKLLDLGGRRLEIAPSEHAALLQDLVTGVARHRIARALSLWKLQPTQGKLDQFADQLRDLAARLGKGAVVVHTEANNLRLAPDLWAGFWSTFAHVVRNAVDHGLEPPEERAAAGKPAEGRFWLRTTHAAGRFAIEVEDDGRGVGMGAVRDACQRLGGAVEVESEPGRGATFRFVFPAEQMTGVEEPVALSTLPPRPGDARRGCELRADQWALLQPIIAGCCQDLLAELGAALSPEDAAAEEPAGAVVGLIGFTDDRISGSLLIAASPALLAALEPSAPGPDWICELANQLLGRIKNKLIPYGLSFYPSTPRCLEPGASHRADPGRALRLRGEHGVIHVSLDAAIDRSFEFLCIPLLSTAAPAEGEMLLF